MLRRETWVEIDYISVCVSDTLEEVSLKICFLLVCNKETKMRVPQGT